MKRNFTISQSCMFIKITFLYFLAKSFSVQEMAEDSEIKPQA